MKMKMQIELNAKEHNALNDLAEDELRGMRQQARQLVREGLQLKGKLDALPANQDTPDNNSTIRAIFHDHTITSKEQNSFPRKSVYRLVKHRKTYELNICKVPRVGDKVYLCDNIYEYTDGKQEYCDGNIFVDGIVTKVLWWFDLDTDPKGSKRQQTVEITVA